MDEVLSYFRVKKNLINLLLLLVLVLSVPVGVKLIQQRQIFFSKAAGEPISLTPNQKCISTRNGKAVATCTDISVQLISPLGGPTVEGPAITPFPSVTPLPQSDIKLTVDRSTVFQNEVIKFTWTNNTNPSASDWLGMYPPSIPEGAAGQTDWFYLGSCGKTPGARSITGSCSFTVSSHTFLEKGVYNARIFANDGSTQVSNNASFTVNEVANLTVTPDSSNPLSVRVQWANVGNPSPRDWVGFYTLTQTGAEGQKEWAYINSCDKNIGSGSAAAGTCTVNLPATAFPTGTYTARLYSDGGQTLISNNAEFVINN